MDTNDLVTEKFFDQYLFNVLTLLMKIFKECQISTNSKYNEITNKLYGIFAFNHTEKADLLFNA